MYLNMHRKTAEFRQKSVTSMAFTVPQTINN
jgi:hypothetical protein